MTHDFHSGRFLKTAARLSSDNEHERAIAAHQASRMLEQAGLTWEEVLRNGLPDMHVEEAESIDLRTTVSNIVAGAGQIFGNWNARRKAADEAPVRKIHYRGTQIPAEVQGIAQIIEHMEQRFLIVVLENERCIYGPLLVRLPSMDLIHRLKARQLIQGTVVGPAQALDLPEFKPLLS